jgi:hypothetical protein
MILQMNVGYFCKYDEAVLEDEILMCKYDMSTLNAVELGCRHEIQSHGMIKVRFTALNKIIHLEIMFDVMSFMQQLRRASGRSDFIVSRTGHFVFYILTVLLSGDTQYTIPGPRPST